MSATEHVSQGHASRGEERTPDDETAPPRPATLAYLASGLGGLLFVLSVGLLGYDGLSPSEEKAVIELRVLDVSRSGSNWLARIEARNDGDATGAGVKVEGRLMTGDREIEAAEAEFDYVPPGSVRQGGLYFSQDPNGHEVRLRVLGYVEP